MPELQCDARRVGDFESRTEEYELTFTLGPSQRVVRTKYLASRAYEINAALDLCVEEVRALISEAGLDSRPTDEALSKLSWYAMQSVKYDEGASKRSTLEV
ncbi:Hypothetical Protein RradSPS_1097 [Rubrobacter radiotolerans]|uniref:Uncharacterized protein n=1 Tax=Rubrobacter radiotolerans TaxID=42256 RepID=A0A023X2Z5_RUBRA|nr:hypothetical protein [Rubrobacter radiotolerans]AHY46380.1 Hypothetical Protein RradSPS_1097 [Rubrobacter radiotolerans]MDX5893787.1 hypothetical protein [Rubrobacter radiotolerans]SMC04504.1 conserved hypothetical protein [Rubrobacter radiotolerans DSM 5868]